MMHAASPRVLIIYTGGTIGMVENPVTKSLHPFDFSALSAQVPELAQLDVHLDTYSVSEPIDSSNMNPDLWGQLAQLIFDRYENYDGFVVLHGSDTMAYTASALTFMFENLNKPVILTGSQLPIGMIRTDGKENLISAIEIASARQMGSPIVAEVAVYFENQLYRGNRTHKHNAEQFEAFQSPNYPILAEAGIRIIYNTNALRPCNQLELKVHTQFDTQVGVITVFPGITEAWFSHLLSAPGIKAFVLRTFGSGNTPSQPWFLQLLQSAIERGIIILNVTQCAVGQVEQGRYETSVGLRDIGIVGGGDLTLEAAVTKLMFLLAQNLSFEECHAQLQRSLRGELTESKND
ncbi:MAG: asparaginase [Salibacteraceae bacterium]